MEGTTGTTTTAANVIQKTSVDTVLLYCGTGLAIGKDFKLTEMETGNDHGKMALADIKKKIPHCFWISLLPLKKIKGKRRVLILSK